MIDPRKFDDLKKYFAEFNAIAKGELDAEYKKVQALIAEWDKRNNLGEITKTNAADAAKNAADRQALEKEKADHAQLVSSQTAKLQKYEADLKSAATAHNNAVAAHATAVAEFDSAKVAHSAGFAAREAKLAERERNVEDFQSKLHQREVALNAKDESIRKAVSSAMAGLSH